MKKTLTGILLMVVAAIMTLSGAVFAANVVTVAPSASEVKVGEEVVVTVTNVPAGVTGYQYVVNYDKTLLSTTADEDGDGTFNVVYADLAGKATPSSTITFKALKEGTATVTLKDVEVSGAKGSLGTEDEVSTSVKVVAATPVEEPTKAEEPAAEATKAEEAKSDADKTKTSLKSTKTGFDAMYVVYLAAAVLAAAGIVTVAKRS